MAKKKIELEEGNIFSVKVDENVWTIAQLCNLFKFPNSRLTTETLAFFNYKAESEEQIIKELDLIDLSKPIMITTINGHPIKHYDLKIIGTKAIYYSNEPNYKNDISKNGGDYKKMSQDYQDILASYFGVLPWDMYAKDDYMETTLLPNYERRQDVKYMKDFNIDEIQEFLSPDSPKLIKRLKEEQEKQ
jgi:hypothetical protein